MNTMKILKTFTLVLLFTATISSCKKDCFAIKGKGDKVTQSYTLPAFTMIRNSLSADVYLTQDSVASLSVKGQSNILDILELKVENNELSIGFKNKCGSIKYDDLEIDIHLPTLEKIDISGSGNVQTMNQFTSNSFQMNVSGSGNITAAIISSTIVKGNISGSGGLYLSGATPIEDFTISGSGDIRSYALSSDHSSISISGSGNADVYVNDHLDARISGSGDIKYKGNATVNSSISGSGSVKHVD
jgi:hypothetical protein